MVTLPPKSRSPEPFASLKGKLRDGEGSDSPGTEILRCAQDDMRGWIVSVGCMANMRLYCLDGAAFWMVDEAQAQEVVVRGQGQFLVACYDMLGIGRHRFYRF